MSMQATLVDLENCGLLKRYHPLLDPDEQEVRSLLLTPGLELEMQNLAVGADCYIAKVKAALGEFVKGEEIPDDESVLKKLEPKRAHIWEYRITFDPQARIFGAFAAFDTLVAFHGRLRSRCTGGGFADGITKAQAGWRELFGLLQRQRADELSYLISNVG